jgi:hypothetical protein
VTQVTYTDGLGTGYFSNAVCTNQVAVGPCTGAAYAFRYVAGCPARIDTSALDGEFTGQVYVKAGAQCVAADLPTGYSAYVMAGQFMPATFVAMPVEVD